MPKVQKSPLAPDRPEPLWMGPEADHERGGITFSLLNRFLADKERFRVNYVEGIQSEEGFNHYIEYGQMWHTCEEVNAGGGDWKQGLVAYTQGLVKQYPTQTTQIKHWFEVCKVQYSIYLEHWASHPSRRNWKTLYAEQVFKVKYKIPSGRSVYLRGKWDEIGVLDDKELWFEEHKTKSEVDKQKLARQLTFDLQTMIYVIALQEARTGYGGDQQYDMGARPFKGVRYNVVKRPLSGGAGSIRRHKATKNKPEETWESYYARLDTVLREQLDDTQFCRFEVVVTPGDVRRFKEECLDPLLEHVCDWYNWVGKAGLTFKGNPGDPNRVHWTHPFGLRNILDDGGSTELDDYLRTGSMVGLAKTDRIFPELQ